MAELNLLKVNWNNEKIKDMYNISDEALNSDNFYYITSEGKLAFIEKRVNNTAEAIAKVFYTLGLMDENRVAKDRIACGIICNKKHQERVQEVADDVDDDDDDDNSEEINKTKNAIAAAMLSVNDQIDAITKEVIRIQEMVSKLSDLVD